MSWNWDLNLFSSIPSGYEVLVLSHCSVEGVVSDYIEICTGREHLKYISMVGVVSGLC